MVATEAEAEEVVREFFNEVQTMVSNSRGDLFGGKNPMTVASEFFKVFAKASEKIESSLVPEDVLETHKWFAAALLDQLSGNNDPVGTEEIPQEAREYLVEYMAFIRNVARRMTQIYGAYLKGMSPDDGGNNVAIMGLVASGELIEDDSALPIRFHKASRYPTSG